MSQREFLREFDADAASAFMDAGIADVATYRSCDPDAEPVVDVAVLIDRSFVGQDLTSSITSASILLTAFRSEIGEKNPPNRSTFTVGAEVFSVDRIMEQSDESRVVMLVTPKKG